jgi:hypothetical protein
MKLTNFKGEDVTKAAIQLRGAIAALEIVNQVPHDIVERLLDIFQTTSAVEFNANFRVMRIQQRNLVMNFVRAEIMNLAESLYSDLSSKGEWNGVANPGDDSVFLGQRGAVCWDCGETGHRAGDTNCKRPKKHSQPCLAKASTKGSNTYSTIPNPKKMHSLVRDDLKPGDRVSLDQYVSSVPGRLAHTYGKEKQRDKLTDGTIFVDHATGHVFIYNQVSARAGETLIGKKKYERLALDSGVSVQTSEPTVSTKAKNWNSAASVLTIRTASPSARFRQYPILHALCSFICRSIGPNNPIWNCGLSLWIMQPTYGTICLVQTLAWPLRNYTQVPSLSATTILLACTRSVVPYMFSTPASKMGTKFRSGNLGLVAVNFWATVRSTPRLLALFSIQPPVTLVHNTMWYMMTILPLFPV